MSDRRNKGVTEFGSSEVSDYQDRIAAAKTGRVPVGGVPLPPMPRFDQAPADRYVGIQSRESLQRILTPEQQAVLAQQGQPSHAVNQPNASDQAGTGQKLGEFINPPRPEGAGIRPETLQQVQVVLDANTAAAKEKAKIDEDLKRAQEEIDEIDESYETDELGNKVRNLLANRARRESIEKRCDTMSIEDLILQGEVRQKVPIVPGKLEPVYRSVGGNEDLFVKRRMSSIRGSDQFVMDQFSIFNLTSGLYSLNGRPLLSHLDKDGEVDDKAFDAKCKVVSRMPLALLADLSVNYVWFGRRLQKLFVVDQIKGF